MLFLQLFLRRLEKNVTREKKMKKNITCYATEEDDEKCSFLNTVFSWNLKDALNEDLYKNKVLLPFIHRKKTRYFHEKSHSY